MSSDDETPVLHRGVGPVTKCKSCKAPITLAEHTTGKLQPFQTDDEGHWVLENGKAVFVGTAGRQLELGAVPAQRYTSHFAVCPQAKQWRNPQ